MNPQLYIVLFTGVGAIVFLFLFVPKGKLMDAHVSILFMQSQSWLYGTLVSEFQLILYPVRILDKGYLANFVFEFVIFPVIAVFYHIYFPKAKTFFIKSLYIVLFPTIITLPEVLLEKNTDLIQYTNWAWYWSWITILITLNITYLYTNWFMKKVKGD